MRIAFVLAAVAAGCGKTPEREGMGRVLWHVEAGGIAYADATRVVLWKDQELRCMSGIRGSIAWSADTGGVRPEHAAGELLLFRPGENQESLVAIWMRDGSKRWTFASKDFLKLLTAGDRVFTSDRKGVLQAHSPVDGSPLWKTEGPALVAEMAVDGARAYGADANGTLLAWTLDGGREVWRTPVDRQVVDPLLVVGSRLLVSSGTLARELRAYDSATGREAWRWRGTAAPVSMWVQAGGIVYYSVGANVHAVNADTGERLWQTPATTAPIVGAGQVHVGTLDGLRTLDWKTGKTLWESPAMARALWSDADVVIAANDRKLAALDPTTGRPRWFFETSSEARWAMRAGPLLFVEAYDRPVRAPGAVDQPKPVRHEVFCLRIE